MANKNIKLTIEYDGTRYHGWQLQPNVTTVQGVLEQALQNVTGEENNIIGASRTDTGVHALAQIANFKTLSSIPGDRFVFALNRILPNDIAVKESCEVDEEFHSRFCSVGKKYDYIIYNSSIRSPILKDRAYYISYRLDIDKMKDAALYLLGTHDFTAFKASSEELKSNVRTITAINVNKCNDIITIQVAGNGFLYNMVRIIAGTLVEVGMNKIPSNSIPEIIKSADRRKAGKTAPAQGLYLVEVYY